jgi:hypothetical protein
MDEIKIELEDVLSLSVVHKQRSVKLNAKLIEKQGVTDSVRDILYLHKKKMIIEEKMDELTGDVNSQIEALREYDTKLTQLEYALQAAWRFPQDQNYHRFWERPHCTCPKMDNDDRYPTGHYVISSDCPLHGSGV